MGRAGIFGEYGKAFHPDENITLVSLLRAMLGAQDGPWATTGLSDQEILARAQDKGWLPEDQPPGAHVSREDLARFLIRMLGLERTAQIEGIYQVPYADAEALAPGSLGYVALAWGLGIIKGDGTTFDAQRVMTRAPARQAKASTFGGKWGASSDSFQNFFSVAGTICLVLTSVQVKGMAGGGTGMCKTWRVVFIIKWAFT